MNYAWNLGMVVLIPDQVHDVFVASEEHTATVWSRKVIKDKDWRSIRGAENPDSRM